MDLAVEQAVKLIAILSQSIDCPAEGCHKVRSRNEAINISPKHVGWHLATKRQGGP